MMPLFLFLLYLLINCHTHIHQDESIEYLAFEFTNQFIIWKEACLWIIILLWFIWFCLQPYIMSFLYLPNLLYIPLSYELLYYPCGFIFQIPYYFHIKVASFQVFLHLLFQPLYPIGLLRSLSYFKVLWLLIKGFKCLYFLTW